MGCVERSKCELYRSSESLNLSRFFSSRTCMVQRGAKSSTNLLQNLDQRHFFCEDRLPAITDHIESPGDIELHNPCCSFHKGMVACCKWWICWSTIIWVSVFTVNNISCYKSSNIVTTAWQDHLLSHYHRLSSMLGMTITRNQLS